MHFNQSAVPHNAKERKRRKKFKKPVTELQVQEESRKRNKGLSNEENKRMKKN